MQKRTAQKRNKEKLCKDCFRENASDACCIPSQEICCNNTNDISKERIFYNWINASELNSIPEKSILGLRCGTSLYFADCQYTS